MQDIGHEAARNAPCEADPSPRPVVLITVYDWDSAVGVRRLYAALRQDGQPAMVIQFGISAPTPNTEEVLLFQCMDFDAPTWFNVPSPEDLDELAEHLRRLDPTLVGISVLSPSYQTCVRITEVARRVTRAPVIWGGVHPTFAPEESLQDPGGPDAVVVGEGEEAMVDLARLAAAGERDFSAVPNVATLRPDGTTRRNALRPLIRDLDSIGFFPFRSEDTLMVPRDARERAAARCVSEDLDNFTPRTIMTGLGCPYRCTFCFNEPLAQMYRGNGRYIRRKSVGRVIEECVHARDVLGKRFVAFWDDIFSLDREWLEEFAAEYPRRVGVPYFCYFHPKHTDESFIDLIVGSGCVSAVCGIQSGSQHFRAEYYHRFETDEEILDSARKLNSRIDMTYDMIVDPPYEMEEHWRANIELFLRFPTPFKIATNSFTYLPGCSITERALRDGLIAQPELTWKLADGFDPCNYLQARRTTRQANLYLLMVATQHGDAIARDEIAAWMDDDVLLDDPLRLKQTISFRLYGKARRLYFQERDARFRLERQLARIALAQTSQPAAGRASAAPKGTSPAAAAGCREAAS